MLKLSSYSLNTRHTKLVSGLKHEKLSNLYDNHKIYNLKSRFQIKFSQYKLMRMLGFSAEDGYKDFTSDLLSLGKTSLSSLNTKIAEPIFSISDDASEKSLNIMRETQLILDDYYNNEEPEIEMENKFNIYNFTDELDSIKDRKSSELFYYKKYLFATRKRRK